MRLHKQRRAEQSNADCFNIVPRRNVKVPLREVREKKEKKKESDVAFAACKREAGCLGALR